MKKQKIITLQKKIYERNPDTGEIKPRPIKNNYCILKTSSEIIKEQRVVLNKLITKIDSMDKKLDEIIKAIDNMK